MLDVNIESVSVALDDVVNIDKSSEAYCLARAVGINDTRRSEIWRHVVCSVQRAALTNAIISSKPELFIMPHFILIIAVSSYYLKSIQ